MINSVLWWTGVVTWAICGPAGCLMLFALMMDKLCDYYPALFQALVEAHWTRLRRKRAERGEGL